MTKDLSNIDQCLEAQAFLRNPIEEWKKIVHQLPTNNVAVNELSKLQSIYTELQNAINAYKKT